MKKFPILIIPIILGVVFSSCTNKDSEGFSSYESGYEEGYLDATTTYNDEEVGLSAYEDYANENDISEDEISEFRRGYSHGYEKGAQQMEEEGIQYMNDLKENWKDYPEFEDCEDFDEVLDRIDSKQ